MNVELDPIIVNVVTGEYVPEQSEMAVSVSVDPNTVDAMVVEVTEATTQAVTPSVNGGTSTDKVGRKKKRSWSKKGKGERGEIASECPSKYGCYS